MRVYLVRQQLSDVTVAPPIAGAIWVWVSRPTNTNNLRGATVLVSLLANAQTNITVSNVFFNADVFITLWNITLQQSIHNIL